MRQPALSPADMATAQIWLSCCMPIMNAHQFSWHSCPAIQARRDSRALLSVISVGQATGSPAAHMWLDLYQPTPHSSAECLIHNRHSGRVRAILPPNP
jgi:hypothetical protein